MGVVSNDLGTRIRLTIAGCYLLYRKIVSCECDAFIPTRVVVTIWLLTVQLRQHNVVETVPARKLQIKGNFTVSLCCKFTVSTATYGGGGWNTKYNAPVKSVQLWIVWQKKVLKCKRIRYWSPSERISNWISRQWGKCSLSSLCTLSGLSPICSAVAVRSVIRECGLHQIHTKRWLFDFMGFVIGFAVP